MMSAGQPLLQWIDGSFLRRVGLVEPLTSKALRSRSR